MPHACGYFLNLGTVTKVKNDLTVKDKVECGEEDSPWELIPKAQGIFLDSYLAIFQ